MSASSAGSSGSKVSVIQNKSLSEQMQLYKSVWMDKSVRNCLIRKRSQPDDKRVCFLLRDSHSGQEQPKKPEGAPPGNSTASSTTLTGCITTVTDQDDNPNRALPRLQQAQQQQHVQHINNQHQHLPPRLSHPQHPPQQQWGVGILQPPHLARLPSQPFSSGHMLGPLTTLGGIRSILGPTPVWTGGLGPPGAATLVWGFPQAGTGASLMGGYHNPAGQGNSRYRGGQRGGGFNGM